MNAAAEEREVVCERSDSPRSLGEGAVTCPFTGNLIYIDVTRGKIFIYDPILRREVRCIHLRQTIGTVVPLAKGSVVAALVKGICVVNTETGKIEKIICNPEHSIVSNRWNDGKCDPQGRLWVGSMDFNCEADAGSLYRISGGVGADVASAAPAPATTAVRVDRMITPTTISNGICWSGDGETLYYIDTATRCVDAFDFDGGVAAGGSITNRRVIVRCSEEEGAGHPDGCTIDNEDNLFVAMWGGSRVNRYSTQTGELLGSWTLPCAQVTSVAFGGPALDQLFVTTARCGLSDEERAATPLAGCLFRIDFSDTGITGVRTHTYSSTL